MMRRGSGGGRTRPTPDRPQLGMPNRPGPQGQGRQQQGYDLDTFKIGKGGQMSVGDMAGGRSWLGKAETPEGSLVPMGEARNGYMQFGRVPIGNYTNVNPNSRGTPFAVPGMDRAGFANHFGWDAIGGQNNKAWRNMFGTGGYETYGQPTGTFADAGIQKYGETPDPMARGRTRRTRTFGQVGY